MKTTKRRVVAISMILMFIISTLAVPAEAKPKSYKFTYKKATVTMSGPAKKLIKKAGKPKSKKKKNKKKKITVVDRYIENMSENVECEYIDYLENHFYMI